MADAMRHTDEVHKMPDNDTWPPKPDLPDPLTEYDEVIAAKLATLSQTKTGPNKIQLIKALRDEEGIDLSRAYALVNSYCARNGALVQTRASRIRAWLGCLALLSALSLAVFTIYFEFRREAVLRLPHHHAVLLALREEEAIAVCTLVALLFLNTIVQAVRLPNNRRK